MQACGDFGRWSPDDQRFVGFNLSATLAQGDVIVSAVWSCKLVSGTDSDPNSHIIGDAEIDGDRVYQMIGNFLPVCNYAVSARVVTQNGEVLEPWAYVYGVPVGQVLP